MDNEKTQTWLESLNDDELVKEMKHAEYNWVVAETEMDRAEAYNTWRMCITCLERLENPLDSNIRQNCHNSQEKLS